MTQVQQPEALRLAAICETKGMFPVADELNRMHARILELEQGKCLHQIAEPAANLTSELADMLERSITGLGHYRNTDRWSEADEEHIHECNALLERFNSSDDEREAAPQAVQAAGATLPWPRAEVSDLLERLVSSHISALIAGERGSNKPEVREFIKSALVEAAGFIRAMLDSAQEVPPQAVQPAVPVDMRLVPAEFVRGFGDLAHNYSLAAVAPDYYYGVERDAFSAAYKRCGNDLAKLREILTAAPAHPAEGVPAQAVQITLTGYQLLAALRLANPSLDFAPMELLTDIVLSETPLVDFDGAQLHEGPIAWVDGVNESAIALEAEPENDLRAATQPAAQGMDAK